MHRTFLLVTSCACAIASAPIWLVAQAPASPAAPTAAVAPASLAPGDSIPNDTAVTIGTLPNGLRYYIRVNHKPAHRAELRLVVKAGSLMEDDDQRGLAHYVEHMAFNGTTHFKKNDLIDYLQSIGVRFGADLNANTGFDRTLFILPVPTDTLAQVKQALQILEDWAHNVTFNQQDFDDERGVILSERRSGLGAGSRVRDQQIPVLYKGSKYPDRLPIGTLESVEHATRDEIVRFYQKWYRPDRMAVIAVGDFDKKQMEEMIRTQFSQIPKPTTPNPAPQFPIPPQPGTLVSVVSDPEVTGTNVGVIYKGPADPRNTLAAERGAFMRSLFDEMINERLQEVALQPSAPFLGARVSHGGLSQDVSTVELGVAVPNNGTTAGLSALLTEVARVAQHGFTQSELDRAKQQYLASVDNYYQSRNDRYSSQFADAYIQNFVSDARVPSAETQVAVSKEIVPSITVASVDSQVSFWQRTDNRVMLVTEPQKAEVQPPDTTALLALFKTVPLRTLAAYTDTASSGALISHPPKAGTVVSEKTYPDVGVTEWKLSNGAVVFLKPTNFQADQLGLAGTSPGGMSLIADSDFPTALYTGAVTSVGGFGNFSLTELQKRLTGKLVSAQSNIGGTSETISAGAAKKDVETMLQLVYMLFTEPRYDSSAIAAMFQRSKASLANRSESPAAAFQDTIQSTLTQHSKRSPLPSVALLDQIDPHRAFALYKDRFADASGFAFMFVGDFNPDSLKPLVELYLASLPALNRHEEARDVGVHRPDGVVQKIVYAGREPQAQTIISFSGAYDSSAKNANDMQVMTQVLENRLRERLREQMGGTYTVQVGSSREIKPVPQYVIDVSFMSDPTRREEMTKAAFAVIDSLKRTPPTAAELHEVIEPALRELETARKTNGYWFNLLTLYDNGRNFNALISDSVLTATTSADVQRAAQKYLNVEHYAQFDLVPAAAPAPTPAPAAAPGTTPPAIAPAGETPVTRE